MRKIKLSVISVAVVCSICSCSNEQVLETMFYDDEISFADYQEYTEPETYRIPEITSIPDIPEFVHTELVAERETVSTTQSMVSSAKSAETSVTTVSDIKEDDFVCINVPYISQKEEYPTGCELVSASMLLKFYGFDITAGELIDKGYMEQAEPEYDSDDDKIYCADPNEAFIGNPRSDSGYGCYAPALLECLEKYLEDEYFDAVNLSGISLPDLCMEYIDFGEPVLIWASINMSGTSVVENAWTIKKTGKSFDWIANEHCLVLVGYDNENYYFNDPQKDVAVPYKKETAEKRYKELGSQAITIRPW